MNIGGIQLKIKGSMIVVFVLAAVFLFQWLSVFTPHVLGDYANMKDVQNNVPAFLPNGGTPDNIPAAPVREY